MNNRQILEEVYKDFFGTSISMEKSETDVDKKTESTIENSDDNYSIDNLYIDDESKILLNKIIQYIKDYSEGKEKNYLTFNICIESNDKSTISEIIDVLTHYTTKYKYINGNKNLELSLYKLSDASDITKYYQDNSIVSIKDLDAISMNDVNFHKKFFYNFLEELNDKKLTVISGKKDVLNSFLLEDDKLDDVFSFRLIGITPSVNDVYNELKEKINNLGLDEEFDIKVLDYITETFPKSEDTYTNYVNNLYRYISFNKEVPKIDEVKSTEEVFKELNELVGLDNIKNTLRDLVDLITLKNKTKDDLKINNVNLHMVFLGNPGTGKTTVARMIADILYNLKYIKQNKLIEVSSKDLVAEYVGQTAVKTMNVVNKAMGGILFVDEAYALADKNNDNSFNGECIATLIKAMEDYRDDLVVIFAGYTKEMQAFLDSNSGITSRIGYTMEFKDYTNDELKQIFRGMVTKAGFILEEDALEEVEKLINENRDTKNFGNARFIRNIYEKTVINHASNTKNNKSKKILKTITKKDITL